MSPPPRSTPSSRTGGVAARGSAQPSDNLLPSASFGFGQFRCSAAPSKPIIDGAMIRSSSTSKKYSHTAWASGNSDSEAGTIGFAQGSYGARISESLGLVVRRRPGFATSRVSALQPALVGIIRVARGCGLPVRGDWQPVPAYETIYWGNQHESRGIRDAWRYIPWNIGDNCEPVGLAPLYSMLAWLMSLFKTLAIDELKRESHHDVIVWYYWLQEEIRRRGRDEIQVYILTCVSQYEGTQPDPLKARSGISHRLGGRFYGPSHSCSICIPVLPTDSTPGGRAKLHCILRSCRI